MRSVIFGASILWLLALSQSTGGDVPWPQNGGIDNIRYSPLAQINRTNVTRLQVAWTYDSHDAFRASEMQSNPVVLDGVLYATTPTLKVVAIDAATGREIWKFDPSGGAATSPRFRHRGVTCTETACSSAIEVFSTPSIERPVNRFRRSVPPAASIFAKASTSPPSA